MRALAIAAVSAAALFGLLGVGCGSDASGPGRAVEWSVDRPVGQKWVRLAATVEWCSYEVPRIEDPIIEYAGKRVYIELRLAPQEREEGQNGCLLSLLGIHKTITLQRDLDELVLYDASTDPPAKRWPTD